MMRCLFIYLLISTIGLTACNDDHSTSDSQNHSAVESATEQADFKYVCPMHAQIIRDAPGTCPICGMTLIKKNISQESPEIQESTEDHSNHTKDEHSNHTKLGEALADKQDGHTQPDKKTISEQPTVTLNGQIIQSMGVRTAEVTTGTLVKTIKTVGYVSYDQNRVGHVHVRTTGWIEKLLVRTAGEIVKEDQVLLEMYSPEILAAQEEFLVSLRTGRSENSEMLKNTARERLRLLQIPEIVIKKLETTGKAMDVIPVSAHHSGVVTNLGVREGMYITPEMELFTITDVSSVWVLVDVFEHQLAWLRVGQSADMELTALPGQQWQGEVDYIYPELDPKTRTLKVRLRFANPKNLLRPNMFAQVVIAGGEKQRVLKVPQESVIITGERKSVIKALGAGKFKPVDITTGMSDHGEIEVLTGLREGDKVVVSGQFLIDSEASLRASFQRLEGGDGDTVSAPAHRH